MNELRESLAEYAHSAWSGWMLYQERVSDGTFWLALPEELKERWQRQMSTPYAFLPESEKESDRDEADKMLSLMRKEKP